MTHPSTVKAPETREAAAASRRWASWLIGAWLSGLLVATAIAVELGIAVQLVALVWPLPILGLLLGRGFWFAPVFRRSRLLMGAVVLYLTSIFPGAATSIEPTVSLSYWAATVLAILLAAGVWESGRRVVERAFVAFALVGAAVTGVFVAVFYESGARLTGLLTPHSIAFAQMGLVVAALSSSRKLLRRCVVAFSMLVIVATGSRTSLLAAMAMVGTLLVLEWPVGARLRAWVVVLGMVTAGIGLAVWGDVVLEQAATLLALGDPRRNPLETSLTGRLYAWQDAIELWWAHPWFGVGYRMHAHYFSEQGFSEFSSAHNGYLMALAELGVVGVVPLLLMIGLAVHGAAVMARRGDRLGKIGLAFAAGIAVEALAERILINIGSSSGILFLLFLFRPADVHAIPGMRGVLGARLRPPR